MGVPQSCWHTQRMGKPTEAIEREGADTDVISLTIPSATRFVRLARIGVASLARRKGMSVRSIDDLRLAVDETFALLLGDVDRPGAVDVTFEVDDHELAVIVVARLADGPPVISEDDRTRFDVLLEDLVDRFDVDDDRGAVQFSKLL